jgi:hypothetical protein
MSKETTLKGKLGDLERLLSALTANSAEVPHLEVSRAQLESLLSQAQGAADLQALHTAAKQEASQKLKLSLNEGMRLANVLRLALKQHYGIRSEKLAHFGLQPFRGRRPKPTPEEPPALPPPAPHDPAAQ